MMIVATVAGLIALILVAMTIVMVAMVSQLRKMVYLIGAIAQIEIAYAEVDDDETEEVQPRKFHN